MRDRAIVDKLIEAINRKFEANAHKGTWTNMSDGETLGLMVKEIDELVDAVHKHDFNNAIEEAADTALFAAFYADPQRVLHE